MALCETSVGVAGAAQLAVEFDPVLRSYFLHGGSTMVELRKTLMSRCRKRSTRWSESADETWLLSVVAQLTMLAMKALAAQHKLAPTACVGHGCLGFAGRSSQLPCFEVGASTCGTEQRLVPGGAHLRAGDLAGLGWRGECRHGERGAVPPRPASGSWPWLAVGRAAAVLSA